MSKPKSKALYETTRVPNLLKNRESGIFYAVVKVAGKQVWHSHRTRVREDAEILHAKYMANVRGPSSGAVLDGRAPMSTLIAEYRRRVEADAEIKPATKQYRLKILRMVLREWPGIETTSVRSVRTSDVNQFRSRFRAEYSPATTNGAVTVVRALFELARELGMRVSDNPAREIKHARCARKELDLPSVAQFEDMCGKAVAAGRRGPDAVLLMRALAYSGMRIGEARHLEWKHVDFDQGVIEVAGDPALGTKGGRASSGDLGKRTIPMLPAMRATLETVRSRGSGTGKVFKWRSCAGTLKTACVLAGRAALTQHDLRHLFISACIDAGMNPTEIAAVVGHKDAGKTIYARYAHAFRGEMFSKFQNLTFKP